MMVGCGMIVTLGGVHEVIMHVHAHPTGYLSGSLALLPLPIPTLGIMSTTEWSLDFCLVCDRQTLGAPYCSQTCRLAELDRPSESLSRSSVDSSSTASHPSSSSSPSSTNPRGLMASSSQTSLSSLQSQSSNSIADQLQDELRDYASCFDPVRDLKRRLTTS